ncbi:hypothetical protein GN244_ATG08640 [Phytophthora infestans]|uniref:Uncharacterized protein n=1 Tax=Phytophthora infestans TaxID=4787 RepID=A0A833T9W3_PHYIN|nr:hypothetical protein GN244_ATG08640 [Phytophthora infestans]
MEITSKKYSTTPAATTQSAQAPNATDDEDEEEMPLLFMDELPSNFRQSAQLAAIATFIADSDDGTVDDRENALEDGNSSKQRRQLRHKSTRTRRRQQPYTKPLQSDNAPKSTDTKELQLFLSMFHVS